MQGGNNQPGEMDFTWRSSVGSTKVPSIGDLA